MALLLAAAGTGAAAPDSTATDEASASWLFIPSLFYTPETRIGGGAALGYYFRDEGDPQASGVQSLFFLTQNRQFIVAVVPTFLLDGGLRRVDGTVRASRYPDEFFGVGDRPAPGEKYTADVASLLLSYRKTVRPGLLIGPQVAADFSRMSSVEDGGALATTDVVGRETRTVIGGGVLASWDTRDNRFSATRGSLVEFSVLHYLGAQGRGYSFTRSYLDARHFVGLGDRHVVGFQAFLDAALGEAPFQLLPFVGGARSLRGYREGRYRDDALLLLQAEYRVHLFWRLGAVAFAGVGRTGSSLLDLVDAPTRPAAGGGLRLRINDDGINFRVDYGVGDGDHGVYVTAIEAF